MRRRPTKAKAQPKQPPARSSSKGTGSSGPELERRLADALGREAEALEQQAATAEILRVISSSPSDVQSVFDTIVRNTARLCDAYDVWVGRLDGSVVRVVAHHGPIALPTGELPVVRGTVAGRTVLDGRTVHVADILSAADEYPEG